MNLTSTPHVIVQQRRELVEFFGFETRNKYEIFGSNKESLGFCAEQQKGFFGFLMRQFLGHWRSFELHFYNVDRQQVMTTHHPFRFLFQEFEVTDREGRRIGYVKQRWGFIRKIFDIENANGLVIMKMKSGFFQFWTFPIFNMIGRERALIKKKWSGLLQEMYLDADNFMVHFKDEKLKDDERALILASSVFIDLQYFERKARG